MKSDVSLLCEYLSSVTTIREQENKKMLFLYSEMMDLAQSNQISQMPVAFPV